MKPVLALLVRALRQLKNSNSSLVCRLLVGLILLLCLWGTQEAAGWSGAPGKAYFSSLVSINYLLVTIGAVAIGAGAIAGEKQEGSLGLLRLANLSPISLLLGKCAGQLTGLLLLLAFQIPFTLLAVTLGGVAVRQVFESYALLGSYLIALTSLGLFSSVVLAKVWRAAVMTISASLCLALLPVWLQSASERLNPAGFLWDQEKQMVVNLSSVKTAESSVDFAAIKVADQLQRAAAWIKSVLPLSHWTKLAGLSSQSIAFSRSLLVHGTFAAFFFALAWLLFERYCGDETRYGESRKGQPIRQRIRFFRLARPAKRPIAWKDFHFHFGGRPWFILRLVAYPLITAIVSTQGYLPINNQTIVMNMWAVGIAVLYFDVTFFVIRSWGPEVWHRNLGQLVLTPNSFARLNLQKCVAFAVALIPSVILPLAALAMDRYSNASAITWRSVIIYFSIAAQSLFFFSLCLYLSIRHRWMALFGAFIEWYLALVLVRGGLMMITLPYMAKGRWMRTNLFEVIEAAEVFLFLAAAVAIYFGFQRQLIRRAAES